MEERTARPNIGYHQGSHENLRLQISKISGVVDTGERFSEAVSVNHLLSLIIKETLDLTGTNVCIIWLKDNSGNLIPRMSFGLKTPAIRSFKLKTASELARCIMSREGATYIRDLKNRVDASTRRLIVREGLLSLVAAPLVACGERIGVLMVSARERRRFEDVDLKVFEAVARQSTLAIMDIGLYERMDRKVKEKIKEMSMLFTMSRSISSSIDVELLLEIILEKVKTLMNARFCTLRLLGETRKRMRLTASAGLSKDELKRMAGADNNISRTAMSGSSPVVVPASACGDGKRLAELKRKRVGTVVAVPLLSHRRKIGVLSVYIMQEKIFAREDMEMFEMVGSLCSMAIENSRMIERVKRDYLNTIKTLARIIDENDSYTRGHCEKVMRYSILISKRLGLPERVIQDIKTASLLHDIGKIGIDLGIIQKKGKLEGDDWKKVRLHPEIGARIVSQVGFLQEVVPIIQHHHERFGGGGYPDARLMSGNIPLGARVIAVADAFDAMTSDRPYREAMSKEAAREELKRCAGSQFDPNIVDAFLKTRVFCN